MQRAEVGARYREFQFHNTVVVERGDDIAGFDERSEAYIAQSHHPGKGRFDQSVLKARLDSHQPRFGGLSLSPAFVQQGSCGGALRL